MTAQFLFSGHLESSVWIRFYKDDVQHLEHCTSISRKDKAYVVLQLNTSKTNKQTKTKTKTKEEEEEEQQQQQQETRKD